MKYELVTGGFNIKPGVITKKTFQEHKEKLLARPNAHLAADARNRYGPPDKPFPLYRISTDGIMIPKYYGLENFDKDKKETVTLTSTGESINVEWLSTMKLRDHQVLSVSKIIESYNKLGGAVLCLGCGLGKTVVALHMISKMKLKTLVIVHKEFLVNQWIDRANMFLPGVKIGILKQNKVEIEGNDIVIAMLQSLSMKEYPTGLLDCFGQVIVDECHHIAAKVFCNGMYKVKGYSLGLSATPDRKDGLGKVINWFLGPIVLSMSNISENKVTVKRYITDFEIEEVYNRGGKLNIANMITKVSELEDRNKFIIDLIVNIVNSEDGDKRQILVLCERRAQLEYFSNKLGELDIENGLYMGGIKQKELDNSSKAKVILGTYAMSSEGFDVPTLNTLILASSKTDIEQSVGRVLRKIHDIPVYIIDICDMFSIFRNQSYQRRYFYKNKEYEIKTINNNQVVPNEVSDETGKNQTTLTGFSFKSSI
tara:strand:+ start:2239 stop:3684 length:1446 start_codon:yes stop_codon:yes gene_type:complete